MINWNQLNAALRRALRVMPACGMLILIAAVVLAVFERSMQTALTGITLGLIVLELGFLALRPEEGADVKPEPRPELPAPAPEPAQAKPEPAQALYCPHCGALRVEQGQKFCTECGKRLRR